MSSSVTSTAVTLGSATRLFGCAGVLTPRLHDAVPVQNVNAAHHPIDTARRFATSTSEWVVDNLDCQSPQHILTLVRAASVSAAQHAEGGESPGSTTHLPDRSPLRWPRRPDVRR